MTKLIKNHESYGLVKFNRINGFTKKLFGSNINHQNSIVLEISQAENEYHLGKSWNHTRNSIIRVELSNSQFSELITTMNIGNGVPCTIRYKNGKKIEDVPEDDKTDVEKSRDDIKIKSKEFIAKIIKEKLEIDDLLKKNLLKSYKEKIKGLLDGIIMEITCNFPFYLDCFNESIDITVTQAKSEIDAFVTHNIIETGLKEIKKLAINMD